MMWLEVSEGSEIWGWVEAVTDSDKYKEVESAVADIGSGGWGLI